MTIPSKNYLTRCLLFCSFFPATFAQAQGEKEIDFDVFETIQIRGIKGSMVESLNVKRFSNNFVDAISAEDIGLFPDQNVAESLQRIAGVALVRAFGEGDRISIRGTEPSQNRTYLNGQNIASEDWWITSSPNRAFNYTMLPSEIVDTIEVHKSATADQDEGSLGGSVNIKTRKPLELEDNQVIVLSKLQYSDLSEETDPQLSLMYNWKNDYENFAALFSFTRHERNLRRDGLEVFGWSEQNFNLDQEGQLISSSFDDASYNDVLVPGLGGSALFQQKKTRTTLNASLQWQPDREWNFEFNAFSFQLGADNSNQNSLWLAGPPILAGDISNHKITDNVLVSADFSEGNSSYMEAISRSSKIKTSSYHLSVENSKDAWQNKYQIGYTSTGNGGTKELLSGWKGPQVSAYDTSQHQNVIVSYQGDQGNPATWSLVNLNGLDHNTKDSEFYLQSDFKRILDINTLDSIEFGFKYRDHKRAYSQLRNVDDVAGLDVSIADYSASFIDNYLAGIGSAQTEREFAFLDINRFEDSIQRKGEFVEYRSGTFDITEKTTAFYFKANIEGNGMRGNAGVRIVNTQQYASAYQSGFDLLNTDTALGDEWRETKHDYLDILPSFAFAFDVSEDIVFRVAAAKLISRAEYNQIAPTSTTTLDGRSLIIGNPTLEPVRATQFDLGLEWYFDDIALLSTNVFVREVLSYIEVVDVNSDSGIAVLQPDNTEGGQTRGLEVSWQQELFGGFGLNTNYTFLDGTRESINNKNIMPGLSKHSANLSLFYENESIRARLAYNYRSKYQTGLLDTIADSYGQWDANFTYNLSGHFSILLDAINLTDETVFQYRRNRLAPTNIYKNGRRLFVGFRYQY